MGRLRRELRFLEHGVEELEAEVGVQINSTQEEKERCEELTSSVPKSPIYRRAPVGKNEEKAEKALQLLEIGSDTVERKEVQDKIREKKQLKNLSRLKRLLRIWREKTKAWD